MSTLNKPATILFIQFLATGAAPKDQAMIVGASAVALGFRPRHYLGLIAAGALAKGLEGGSYTAAAEIANNCAIGGLLASVIYLVHNVMKESE